MEQVGLVVETRGDMARVRTQRHTACQACGKCDGGLSGLEQARDLTVLAHNPIGAQEGDLIEMKMEAQRVLLAAFLVYTLPLLNFLLGYVLARWLATVYGLGQVEASGIIVGFIFLLASFFLLRSQEHRFAHSRRFTPVIVSVLEAKE